MKYIKITIGISIISFSLPNDMLIFVFFDSDFGNFTFQSTLSSHLNELISEHKIEI